MSLLRICCCPCKSKTECKKRFKTFVPFFVCDLSFLVAPDSCRSALAQSLRSLAHMTFRAKSFESSVHLYGAAIGCVTSGTSLAGLQDCVRYLSSKKSDMFPLANDAVKIRDSLKTFIQTTAGKTNDDISGSEDARISTLIEDLRSDETTAKHAYERSKELNSSLFNVQKAVKDVYEVLESENKSGNTVLDPLHVGAVNERATFLLNVVVDACIDRQYEQCIQVWKQTKKLLRDVKSTCYSSESVGRDGDISPGYSTFLSKEGDLLGNSSQDKALFVGSALRAELHAATALAACDFMAEALDTVHAVVMEMRQLQLSLQNYGEGVNTIATAIGESMEVIVQIFQMLRRPRLSLSSSSDVSPSAIPTAAELRKTCSEIMREPTMTVLFPRTKFETFFRGWTLIKVWRCLNYHCIVVGNKYFIQEFRSALVNIGVQAGYLEIVDSERWVLERIINGQEEYSRRIARAVNTNQRSSFDTAFQLFESPLISGGADNFPDAPESEEETHSDENIDEVVDSGTNEGNGEFQLPPAVLRLWTLSLPLSIDAPLSRTSTLLRLQSAVHKSLRTLLPAAMLDVTSLDVEAIFRRSERSFTSNPEDGESVVNTFNAVDQHSCSHPASPTDLVADYETAQKVRPEGTHQFHGRHDLSFDDLNMLTGVVDTQLVIGEATDENRKTSDNGSSSSLTAFVRQFSQSLRVKMDANIFSLAHSIDNMQRFAHNSTKATARTTSECNVNFYLKSREKLCEPNDGIFSCSVSEEDTDLEGLNPFRIRVFPPLLPPMALCLCGLLMRASMNPLALVELDLNCLSIGRDLGRTATAWSLRQKHGDPATPFPFLRRLRLSACNLSISVAETLIKLCPVLEAVDLSDNLLEDGNPASPEIFKRCIWTSLIEGPQSTSVVCFSRWFVSISSLFIVSFFLFSFSSTGGRRWCQL